MISLILTSSPSASLSLKPSYLPSIRPIHTRYNQLKQLRQKRLRDGKCRAELSTDAPVAMAIGACILNSLIFPATPLPEDVEDESLIDSSDARLAVMGIISFIPYFNWMSWVFAWLDTGKRRYAVYAIVYLAPYVRTNLSISPEESWLPIASILLCIFHIQLEASIKNGDIPGFQIFNEAAKSLSSIKKNEKISKEREERKDFHNLPSAQEHYRNEIQDWSAPQKRHEDNEISSEDEEGNRGGNGILYTIHLNICAAKTYPLFTFQFRLISSLLSLMASSPLSSSSLSTLRKSLHVADSKPNFQIPSISFPNLQQQIQTQTLTLALSSNRRHLTLPPPHSSKTSIAVAAASSPPRSLKSRLKNGETLYGIFLLTFSPTLAEIAGLAGYDFAVVDMEHGHGGISDALSCIHALAATNTAAVLRIPESSATWAKKALDLGPQGIMFPMIDGPKSARKAVSYCRFPPNGVRGSAHTIVRASDYGIDEGYLSNFEEELVIMCQVESEEGVKKIDEIAAVEGVDCIQMGPLDLSASMGYLWDPGHKKVKEALRGAEKAVLKGGAAYLSGFVMPHDPAEELRQRGYHMVSGAADVGLFRSAAVADVRKFKMSLVDDDDEKENGAAAVAEEKYWSE
ncbi:Phosphoenolpyruvate carboxylase family protein [Perilla frutescens var. hirtella]|nr:Phosphoenolpyruvate carboxylase family protein [Perilla frutescens var. frutescens]KAH6792554.1 Phosphoenolpyruvate carboxylase family protein [Perilla frutescens var. hirtella]